MPNLNIGGAEPYLIWSMIEEKVIGDRVYEEQNIRLVVKEVKC